MDHLESFRMLAEKHIDVLEGEVKRGKLWNGASSGTSLMFCYEHECPVHKELSNVKCWSNGAHDDFYWYGYIFW